MSTQIFLITAAVFTLGLFLGGNLGIVLMCLLQMADSGVPVGDDLVALAIEGEQ
jgi:hypothetical protein